MYVWELCLVIGVDVKQSWCQYISLWNSIFLYATCSFSNPSRQRSVDGKRVNYNIENSFVFGHIGIIEQKYPVIHCVICCSDLLLAFFYTWRDSGQNRTFI